MCTSHLSGSLKARWTVGHSNLEKSIDRLSGTTSWHNNKKQESNKKKNKKKSSKVQQTFKSLFCST